MKNLTLPNLLNNPNVKAVYTINGKEYTFHFLWCGSFCKLDILSGNKYLVKGCAVTINSDILARVKDNTLITGTLVYKNKYGKNDEPCQENFHTDFYMLYEDDN